MKCFAIATFGMRSAALAGVLSFFVRRRLRKCEGGRVWQNVRPNRRQKCHKKTKRRRRLCRNGDTCLLTKRKRPFLRRRPSWLAAIAVSRVEPRQFKST